MYKLLLLFFISSVALSQPRDLYKDNYLADNTLNKDAKLYANARVRTEFTYEISSRAPGKKRLSGKRNFTTSGMVASNTTFDDESYTEAQYFYTYDEHNRLVKQREEYYRKDTLQSIVLADFKFDAAGNKTESTYSNSAGIAYLQKYKYSKDSNSVKIVNYDELGSENNSSEFFFNKENFLIRAVTIYKGSVKTLLAVYGDDSVRISHIENGKIINYECMYFDSDGNMLSLRLTEPGVSSHLDYKAEYAGSNKTKEFFHYDPTGFWREIKYYDNNGLLVKNDDFMNKTTLMTRRIIKYNSKSLPVMKAYGAEDVTFDAAKDQTLFEYEYY